MKKSLVLAMAMALGVTASAYAANPFTDVPAGHWAYDAVNELAAAGVVEGYGDGSYAGDKLITRYEMAQIVAKAMAKGADCEKLAAEFASELDTLGVKVAALEKKADNVTITGAVRARFVDVHDGASAKDLRTRLWLKGKINDDWSYTGMLQNVQDMSNDAGDDEIKLARAWVEGKVGGMAVTGGRYNAFFGNGAVLDDNVDGVEVAYGSKIAVTAAYGQFEGEDYFAGSASGKIGAIDLTGAYIEFDAPVGTKDLGITSFTAATELGHIGLNATYVYANSEYADVNGDRDGWMLGASYKGADKGSVGSWGLFGYYYDQAHYTYLAHTTDAESFSGKGFEGFGVGANYTVAKNIVATVAYYDTESKTTAEEDSRIWTDVTFSF